MNGNARLVCQNCVMFYIDLETIFVCGYMQLYNLIISLGMSSCRVLECVST